MSSQAVLAVVSPLLSKHQIDRHDVCFANSNFNSILLKTVPGRNQIDIAIDWFTKLRSDEERLAYLATGLAGLDLGLATLVVAENTTLTTEIGRDEPTATGLLHDRAATRTPLSLQPSTPVSFRSLFSIDHHFTNGSNWATLQKTNLIAGNLQKVYLQIKTKIIAQEEKIHRLLNPEKQQTLAEWRLRYLALRDRLLGFGVQSSEHLVELDRLGWFSWRVEMEKLIVDKAGVIDTSWSATTSRDRVARLKQEPMDAGLRRNLWEEVAELKAAENELRSQLTAAYPVAFQNLQFLEQQLESNKLAFEQSVAISEKVLSRGHWMKPKDEKLGRSLRLRALAFYRNRYPQGLLLPNYSNLRLQGRSEKDLILLGSNHKLKVTPLERCRGYSAYHRGIEREYPKSFPRHPLLCSKLFSQALPN